MPGQELRGGEGGDPSSKVFEEIRALQRALKEISQSWGDLEIDPNSDSGTYDDATQSAVKRFQLRIGLDADGVVGESTWHKLEEYYPQLSSDLQNIQQQHDQQQAGHEAGHGQEGHEGHGGHGDQAQPVGQGVPEWDGDPYVSGGTLKFRFKGDMVGAIPTNSVTGAYRMYDSNNSPVGDEVPFYYPAYDVGPSQPGEAEVQLTVPYGATDGEFEIVVYLQQSNQSDYRKTTCKIENDRIVD